MSESSSVARPAPPPDQMPAVVPVGSVFGRAEHAVVGLTEIHVFTTGCLFHFLGAAKRPEPPTPPWGHADQGLRIFATVSGHDDELLRFSIESPSGRIVSNSGPAGPDDDTARFVFTNVEGRGVADEDGSRLVYRQPVWLSPLPTEGKISLGAHWPAYGITQATVEWDCAELSMAADKSLHFWTSE